MSETVDDLRGPARGGGSSGGEAHPGQVGQIGQIGQVGQDRLPIKMLHDRVLVRTPREEGDRRSSGGILIPSTAQVGVRLIWADVLAIGNHVRAVELGDRVLFSPEDRHEVEIHGDGYLILRERDIHAVASPRIEPSTGLYL